MVMDAEENWKTFLEMHCTEDGAIIDSPVYNEIADRFAVPLTHKLISTAINLSESEEHRIRAALLIEDMTEYDRLDTAYPSIDRVETLPYLRRSAIRLMIVFQEGSPLQVAGKELTKKLIRLSLQHNDGWDEFLEWMQKGFRNRPHVLDLILDVFCELGEDDYDDESELEVRDKFAAFVEPVVRANAYQFHTRLRNLLALDQSYNDTAYRILPSFYRIFTHPTHWTTLMEEAIMSPFFDYDPHPYPKKMLAAAISLKLCIQRGGAFTFSSAMIRKINHIILRLYSVINSLIFTHI
ncbi:hypothetical protein C2S52_021994 [Perilla frutescens var. hirtella]|nr:hypothetical protein C2S52_021994 [Perilla frutescens var. hirtella]KAH6807593.1 hypothetical protein C2S51_028701 [Perilla frutescens var. frutescens]